MRQIHAELAKPFWKFSGIRKRPPAPFVPVWDRSHRSKFYPMWIKLRILPISASIPSENRNTASKGLLICDALGFMFAQEYHRPASSELFAERLFFVVAITNFGIRKPSATQLLPDRFNQV